MWESQQHDDIALKRVNELSCMARVTEDRADLLTFTYGDDAVMPGELGTFPRWMNVVAKENPKVFWNYATRMQADLNCDEQAEAIMVGRGVANDVHVVVVENPSVGKPSVNSFEFLARDLETDELCLDDIVIQVQDRENNLEDELSCGKMLNVKNCSVKTIQWTGKSFDIEAEEKENLKKVEK